MADSTKPVRINLPALDLTLTPEAASQIAQWLPKIWRVAAELDLPITAQVEDKTGAMIPRRVLRIEVGERGDSGVISGISVPITLETGDTP